MEKIKIFADSETNKLYSYAELKAEFQELKANNETECETFEEYRSSCMLEENGTLENVVLITIIFKRIYRVNHAVVSLKRKRVRRPAGISLAHYLKL